MTKKMRRFFAIENPCCISVDAPQPQPPTQEKDAKFAPDPEKAASNLLEEIQRSGELQKYWDPIFNLYPDLPQLTVGDLSVVNEAKKREERERRAKGESQGEDLTVGDLSAPVLAKRHPEVPAALKAKYRKPSTSESQALVAERYEREEKARAEAARIKQLIEEAE